MPTSYKIVIVSISISALILLALALPSTKASNKLIPNNNHLINNLTEEISTKSLEDILLYKPEVKILFFGDTIMLDPIDKMVKDPSFNPFKNLLDTFKEYDYIVGDQEGPIDGASVGSPNLNKPYQFDSPKEAIRTYVESGIDAFNYANNHARDYGPKSLMHTMELLHQAGIQTFGAGSNKTEAFKPLQIDLYGNRISLLSYNCAEYIHNIADDYTPGTASYSEYYVKNSIQTAKSNSDIVIVMAHCGTENTSEPNNMQIQWANIFTSAGADIVIGGHTHTRQSPATVNGKPVIYSIGNFMIPGQSSSEEKRTGWMVGVSIKDKKVDSYKLIDVRMDDFGIPALK